MNVLLVDMPDVAVRYLTQQAPGCVLLWAAFKDYRNVLATCIERLRNKERPVDGWMKVATVQSKNKAQCFFIFNDGTGMWEIMCVLRDAGPLEGNSRLEVY